MRTRTSPPSARRGGKRESNRFPLGDARGSGVVADRAPCASARASRGYLEAGGKTWRDGSRVRGVLRCPDLGARSVVSRGTGRCAGDGACWSDDARFLWGASWVLRQLACGLRRSFPDERCFAIGGNSLPDFGGGRRQISSAIATRKALVTAAGKRVPVSAVVGSAPKGVCLGDDAKSRARSGGMPNRFSLLSAAWPGSATCQGSPGGKQLRSGDRRGWCAGCRRTPSPRCAPAARRASSATRAHCFGEDARIAIANVFGHQAASSEVTTNLPS